MYQGSLKSAVRRSLTRSLLLPSDDENEAIQTRANGKAKTAAAVGSISARAHRSRDPTPAKGDKDEEKALAYRNSSDFQLMQVSREAHKLTHMIDSWSMDRHFQGSSEFFAEDLLRGAIGLQDSLNILKKLQDASKKMPQVSNKQRQNILNNRCEGMSPQELRSEGFAVGDHQRRFCESRLSSGDFSRNCIEELKQVIKESLHKQNIMSDDEKSYSSRSMRYSTISNLEDKYLRQNMELLCSSEQPKKARSSNLVAKLMGLEEAPSKTFQPSRKEEKNFVSLPRPRFDIEMPKVRKPHFLVQNNEQEDDRLDDLVETMHFKGLLKRSQIEEKGLEPMFVSAKELEQCRRNLQRVDQLPPIVIMKPLHWHYEDTGVQNEPLEKALLQDRIQEIKLVQENNRLDHHKHILAVKQEQKELKHMEKHIAKTLPFHDNNKQPKKKVIVTQKLNGEEKKPTRLNMKQQEDKRVQATRNNVLNPKTPMVQLKHNGELQHQDLKSHCRTIAKAITDSSKDKTSGVKATRRTAITISANEDAKCNESDTAIKHCIKVIDTLKAECGSSGSKLVEQMNKEKKSLNSAADILNRDPKIIAEDILRTDQEAHNSKSTEIVELPDCKKVGIDSTVEDELKSVLLSSQSFLSCVKKLFSVDATRSINCQKESANMDRKVHSKLYLDISEELMARKYLQLKGTMHPLMQAQSWGRTIYFSIDKLVEEISDVMGKLASYSQLKSVDACEGSLYIRLERELMSKDTIINSAWDIGWNYWICFEEADQVVDEVSRQIFSRLVEEAALELTQDCT